MTEATQCILEEPEYTENCSAPAPTHLDRNKCDSQKAVPLALGAVMRSSPIFPGDSSVLPKLPRCIAQRPGRSLVIWCVYLSAREERFVEALGKVSPVCIRHCPHGTDVASESTILHCRSEIQSFVSSAVFRNFSGMAAREVIETSNGILSTHSYY